MEKTLKLFSVIFCIFVTFGMVMPRTMAGTTLIQLTTNPYFDVWPSWHPSGSTVVYCAFSNNFDRSIWVLNYSNPSDKMALTNGYVDEAPNYSPDGQKIVFVRWGLRGDYLDIMIMHSDGSNIERITYGGIAGLAEGCYSSPQFSSNGQEILFEYFPYTSPGGPDSYIGVMNIDGSNVRIVGNGTYPHWCADYSRIIYQYPNDWCGQFQGNNTSIYIMNRNGTDMIKLTNGQSDHEPHMSSTSKIVFSRNGDLYTMNADGSNVSELIDDGRQPHWSPDGKSIVFFNHKSGARDLWALISDALPLSASITPLSTLTYIGNQVIFTSMVSGGTAPYSYQWYLDGNPVSGATMGSWVFTLTTVGFHYVFLRVTDSSGNMTQSETAQVTVISPPVGGYSFPMEDQASFAKPSTHYPALITIIAIVFMLIRRKTAGETK